MLMRALAMRDTLKASVENDRGRIFALFPAAGGGDDAKAHGAEALLRWRNPHGSMVSRWNLSRS